MGHVLLESNGRHISGKMALIDTGCCPSTPPLSSPPPVAGAAGLVAGAPGKGEGPREGLALLPPPPVVAPGAGGLTVVGGLDGWMDGGQGGRDGLGETCTDNHTDGTPESKSKRRRTGVVLAAHGAGDALHEEVRLLQVLKVLTQLCVVLVCVVCGEEG